MRLTVFRTKTWPIVLGGFSVFLLVVPLSTAQRKAPGSGGGVRNAPARTNTAPAGTPHSAVTGSAPSPQHAEQESDVEFRSETVLIQVPAVVTEKSGAHVHNLTRDDFQVFENGKLQKISSFEEVITDNSPFKVLPATPGEFTNLSIEAGKPRSVVVIALDTVNTPFLDQAYARQQLVKYLGNNLDSGQALAMVIITSRGLKVIQGLTSDPKNLLAAMKKLSGEIPAMQNIDTDARVAANDTFGLYSTPFSITQSSLDDFVREGDILYAQFQQENAIETTMKSFLSLAWSLSGIPGRKTLIWATGSFPFYMDSPSALPGGRTAEVYERAMQALNDAEVSVYPVDVRGLVNFMPGADASQRAATGTAFAQQISGRAWLHNSTLDTLRDFAETTGGRAFYNSNDVAGGFRRATDDASSYYMLAYYLDTHNTKPGWRELKVKLEKKGYEVRARKGFLVTNTTMNPELTRQADVDFALLSPFEATGLRVIAQWLDQSAAPAAGNSVDLQKKKIGFALTVPSNSLTVEGIRNQIDVDFAAVALKDSKKPDPPADNFGRTVKATLGPENLEKLRTSGMTYKNALDLAPGSYKVRFIVRDNFSGRIGSVTAPLVVN
jgi:VWFA-related protein